MIAQHQPAGVQHRAGRLPRRLPGGRDDQDRQGGHLRRHEDPAGDDLHGRLRGRRAVLQQAAPHERPGARVGQAEPERHVRGQLHRHSEGKPSRNTLVPRAPTSSSRWPVASGSARRRRSRPPTPPARTSPCIWVDTDGCVSAATYCKYFLTSVEKGISDSVKAAVLKAADGDLKWRQLHRHAGQRRGVLAPYHECDEQGPRGRSRPSSSS